MKYILILFFNFVSIFAFSQHGNKSIDDIYVQALNKYLVDIEEVNQLYIEEHNITSINLPDSLNGIRLIVLSRVELRKKLRKKKELFILRIVPIRYEDRELFINVIPYKVKRKRRELKMINIGGEKIRLNYDCNNSKLTVK